MFNNFTRKNKIETVIFKGYGFMVEVTMLGIKPTLLGNSSFFLVNINACANPS
jgi:hypothetical protein